MANTFHSDEKKRSVSVFAHSFCLLFALFICSFADSQQPVAIITGIKGEVTVKKPGKNELTKAVWGTQLFQGDQIRTSSDSEAIISLSNNTIFRLGANSSISVTATEPSATESGGDVKKISASVVPNFSTLTSKRENKKETGALAGLRSAGNETLLEPVMPLNTAIMSDRPSFSWLTRKSFDKYVVNLYSSKGLVWSVKVSGTKMEYPENQKQLDPGETYFWNVEGEDLIDNKKSSNSKFTVLPVEKLSEVKSKISAIRDIFGKEPESTLHSVLGSFYIEQGLIQDAISEFQIIAELNPDAPLPHEILGSLYSETGNKDMAIEELQKALSLTKSKDE